MSERNMIVMDARESCSRAKRASTATTPTVPPALSLPITDTFVTSTTAANHGAKSGSRKMRCLLVVVVTPHPVRHVLRPKRAWNARRCFAL